MQTTQHLYNRGNFYCIVILVKTYSNPSSENIIHNIQIIKIDSYVMHTQFFNNQKFKHFFDEIKFG